MSDISNLLIKDSYDYVIQVDPLTRQVLRIGGEVPDNPIFVSGLTVNSSFRFSNGTENAGYFLKCDALGNAKWFPINVSGNTYSITGITVSGYTLFYTDSEGQSFSVQLPQFNGGIISFLVVTGDTYFNGLTANTVNTNSLYLSGTDITDIFIKKSDLPQIKSGKISKILFSGSPYSYDVIFNNMLPDTNYSITITGKDLRVWNVENESISGFTINTNSNVPLNYDTFWQVITIGEFNY